ncbi:MAG: putative manganese transporter [Lachnospiraceae bacterium]|nr:putative manganese transporter [Lachnospiraceae bacterium]
MIDVILDTVFDFIKLLPFLFITYLVMEWIEHNTHEGSQNLIKKAGPFGPILGSILGVFPQCGFSAAGSTFYAGRIISMGTLIAIYMSTSDEMLPVMIAEAAPIGLIIKILAVKIVCAMMGGFIIDLFIFPTRKIEVEVDVDELCTDEQCGCKSGGHNVLIPAIRHTLKTGIFIFIVSFVLNVTLEFAGEGALPSVFTDIPFVENMIAAVVGLIPNCAASVALTTLFIEGAISFSALISGLLAGAGVGLLVLFRVNNHQKENLRILGLLYGFSVVFGFVVSIIGL